MDTDGRLDRFDRAILAQLQRDGRMPVAELAGRIGLSKTPTQTRLKKLREAGVIRGFRAVLNPRLTGREHVAFTEVKLANTEESALRAFNEAVQSIPEIESCHMIAGAFDYLLKVRTEDIRAYRQVLGETISQLPHVANTSTHISMEAVKDAGT